MNLVETVGSYCLCALMIVGTSLAIFLAAYFAYYLFAIGRFLQRGP